MKINKFPSRYVKWNYASISFHFHARNEETKQPAKRDKRIGEHRCKRIHQEKSLNKRHDQCIKLLHLMLPFGKSKNYCRSYEFRQIICPLNKHSQNKQIFGKFFKIQAFEVDINNNSISCNCC